MEPLTRMLYGTLKVGLRGPSGAYPLHVHSYYSVAVAAPLGDPYTLRITNTRPHAVEVLMSVAGYNVLDGRIADPEADYGIVIDGSDSYTFTHWREGDRRFGPFQFGRPGWHATGLLDASNTPSIRLTVFEEKVRQPAGYGVADLEHSGYSGDRMAPIRKRTGAITKNSRPKVDTQARSTIPTDQPGTAEVMGRVSFDRHSSPPHVLDIYYHAR